MTVPEPDARIVCAAVGGGGGGATGVTRCRAGCGRGGNSDVQHHGASAKRIHVVLWVAPDLTLIVGRVFARGRLHPRARQGLGVGPAAQGPGARTEAASCPVSRLQNTQAAASAHLVGREQAVLPGQLDRDAPRPMALRDAGAQARRRREGRRHGGARCRAVLRATARCRQVQGQGLRGAVPLSCTLRTDVPLYVDAQYRYLYHAHAVYLPRPIFHEWCAF